MRRDTEMTCHCGAAYGGSDRCPECGCEQYEAHCDHDIGTGTTSCCGTPSYQDGVDGGVYCVVCDREVAGATY